MITELVDLLPPWLRLLVGGGSVLGAYGLWLSRQETFPERRQLIETSLAGKEFYIEDTRFVIHQVDTVREKEGFRYEVRKHIPRLRGLQGITVVTIRSRGIDITSWYVWEDQGYDEDFDSYLRDICPEDYPEVELIEGDSEYVTSRDSSEVKLKISSVNLAELEDTLSKLPDFHLYYINNYPVSAIARRG